MEMPIDPFNDIGISRFKKSGLSKDVTAFNQQGSRVDFGDLQMLPLADGVLWVRPLYVQSQSSGLPQVKRIIVNYRGAIGLGESLEAAIIDLFPGFSGQIGDIAGSTVDPGQQPGTDPGTTKDPQELLRQAEVLFDEADAALADADWATYGEKLQAARDLVQEALDLLEG